MTSPLTRSLTAVALVTALVASTPTVSTAAAPRDDHRVVHHDSRRDVVRYDTRSETTRPAPRERTADITTTVVDHRADRLVLRAQVRHLSRSGFRLLIAEIRTSDGGHFELDVDYSTDPIGTRVDLQRWRSSDVHCPGATWSVRPSRDEVSASVPRACLGDPDWVRVGVAAVAAGDHVRISRADDSRSDGRIGDEHLVLGPRQHRG